MGIRDNIRREISKAGYGTNLSKFCREKGLSTVYLNQFLNSRRRFNEDMLNKIAAALDVPLFKLFSEEELVPYPLVREEHAASLLVSERFEKIKLFEDSLNLGPGNEITEIPPDDYLLFLKKLLPRGYKSDPDRIVAFPAAGIGMKPTINSGSIVWIDRKDIEPKQGEIFAFWLADRHAVTIKRLIKFTKRFCIIDGDNKNEEDRKSEELQDFPMVIDCRDNEEADHVWPIRGRVIWVLNRLIEKPKE